MPERGRGGRRVEARERRSWRGGAKPKREGRVLVSRAGSAVCGNGMGTVPEGASISRAGGELLGVAEAGRGDRSGAGDPRRDRGREDRGRSSGREAEADDVGAAGVVCGGVGGGAAMDGVGDPAAGDAGAQLRRIRGGVHGRGVHGGRRAEASGGAWTADAGSRAWGDADCRDGRRGVAAAAGRGGAVGGEPVGPVRGGGTPGSGRAAGEAAGGGGDRCAEAADVACVPHVAAGAGAAAVPEMSGRSATACATAAVCVEPERELDRCWRGDGGGVLGETPAADGAVR